MELNGKFCSTCGSDATHMTQKECADACKAEPTCVGYDHGHDGSCTVYGPSIDETPESMDGKPWIAQSKTGAGTVNIVGPDGDSQHPCGLPGARYHEVGTGGCRGNGGTLDK